MPGRQQFRRGLRQSSQLVDESFDGQLTVQKRVVALPAHQTTILVVLHQMVVGVAGEGQGVEAQGIHNRQFQDAQVRVEGLQMGDVEGNDVVAQQELAAL